MNLIPRRRITLFVITGLLLIAFAACDWATAQDAFAPKAPRAFRTEDPVNRGLDANLYMQTAAEYRAACYQAYNLATFRLKEALTKNPTGKPAVIMDLDETVLNNAGYETMMLRSGLAYDKRIWDDWESKHWEQIGLVPGAKEFILEAKGLGVTIAYISNRNEKFRQNTTMALERLGINVPDDSLLKLRTKTSDKTERQQEIENKFTVILYIGDNLRDFSKRFQCRKLEKKTPEELELAIRERKETVDQYRTEFGTKWIILPNPVYGEWTKPLGHGKACFNRLTPQIH